MSEVSLQSYWDMLDKFDWSYMMSDDHSVYTRGSREENRLVALKKQSQEHSDMYDAFNQYRWRKGEKPKRPE